MHCLHVFLDPPQAEPRHVLSCCLVSSLLARAGLEGSALSGPSLDIQRSLVMMSQEPEQEAFVSLLTELQVRMHCRGLSWTQG